MALLQSSRLSSLWTRIVKVSNTSGSSTTTVYMLRRNYTAVQWRNSQFVTTYMRSQQTLFVQKMMVGQPAMLMGDFGKNLKNIYDTEKESKVVNANSSLRVESDKPITTTAQLSTSVSNSSPAATTQSSSEKSTTPAFTGFKTGTPGSDVGETVDKPTTAVGSSNFCAGVTPKPQKETSETVSDGGEKKPFSAPELKLPNREQVEHYFFRSLAFVYDVAVAIYGWMRTMICRHILLNPTVQGHWQNLRNKMEASKRN